MMSEKKIEVENLKLSYGAREVLHGISFDVYRNEILAVIGPAQSGKTSLLRCINRTIDFTPHAKVSGTIKVDGQDVRSIRRSVWSFARGAGRDAGQGRRFSDIYELRRAVGMVAPLPVGLPLSIYDNVAFAPRAAGLTQKAELDAIVEKCLRQAALWDEVQDRLSSLGTKLSGGQQQRLTIARALSHQPEVLCLDEFSIAIDPVTTMRIEEVLKTLRQEVTIILVTNLTQQARRLADRTMFLWNGEIVEMDKNEVIFSSRANNPKTRDYVNGIFG
jgi:phosphate transport system ATP-binding protein